MPANPPFERLYDEHAGALFAFLLNFTRDEADTRDVLQEVFIRLARKPGQLNEVRSERTYLLRLAHNAAVDLMRRRATRDRARDGFAAEAKAHPQPFNLIETQVVPALGNATRKFAYGQGCVDLARVAIALERYRLANGKYPAALSALEPRFLSPVPHDVIGGQPLHYQLDADGQFVLYSVGWNETDDGSTVALRKAPDFGQNIEQGDWVWTYGEMKKAE